MNIFFYINILAGGGAERVIANLANAFSERGNKVSVVTSYKVENEYKTNNKVKRYFLEDKKTECGAVKRNLGRILKLRRLLIKNKPDILISFLPEANFRSIIAAEFLKTKVIVSVRNDPNREYPSKLTRFFADALYSLADGIVFQTEDAKKFFNKRIRDRSTIIPNQVNNIFYSTSMLESRKDIITIGRLTKQKNHKILIKAFYEIKNLINDNLIIYGEGSERKELEKIIKENNIEDRVFLPGNVLNIEQYLSSAKLFVLSSDYEGMPNALLEAMAMGVPCISTDCPCGGPRMIIKDKLNGELVPVGNVRALAESILQLVNNDEKMNRYSFLARKSALMYKPEIVIEQWDDYINSIV